MSAPAFPFERSLSRPAPKGRPVALRPRPELELSPAPGRAARTDSALNGERPGPARPKLALTRPAPALARPEPETRSEARWLRREPGRGIPAQLRGQAGRVCGGPASDHGESGPGPDLPPRGRDPLAGGPGCPGPFRGRLEIGPGILQIARVQPRVGPGRPGLPSSRAGTWARSAPAIPESGQKRAGDARPCVAWVSEQA